MKIIFFDSKSYDKESFTKELVNYPDIEVKFLKTELTPFTAELAHGYDAVCAFVSADISNDTIEVLNMCGVKLILLRQSAPSPQCTIQHCSVGDCKPFGHPCIPCSGLFSGSSC